MVEATILPELPVEAQPTTAQTRLGPIEYASSGVGPAVLALHGAMGGWDQSYILARTLGEPGYRYLAVSRPGYLGTPIASGRSPEAQADLCAALLDALGVERAAVMAVSGGGPCALHFALRHPDRCPALVMASSTGGPVRERIPLSFKLMKLLARSSFFVRSMRRKLEKDPGKAARRSIRDSAVRERTLSDPVVGPLFRALMFSTFDRMAARVAGTENDITVTRTTSYPLEEIAVPTLVVHGTIDELVPFAQHGKQLADRIPSAELHTIEGGEHVAIFTHRDEIRARVSGFMAQHRPASSG